MMDILDAQVHIFRTIGLDQALAAMDALGIRSVMIDEVWGKDAVGEILPFALLPGGVARPLSPLAEAASLKYPERFAFVQRVNRRDPELDALFKSLAWSPGCRSVRVDLRLPEERFALRAGAYDALFELAERHALPICVLGRDFGAAIRPVIERHRGVQFIIDHLGSPQTSQHWEDVLALGPLENAMVKWSHAQHAFGGNYPFPEIQTQLARAINVFGIHRLMWASDFTANQTGHTWADLLYYLRDSALLSDSDKEWFFSRTARGAFHWAATPRP